MDNLSFVPFPTDLLPKVLARYTREAAAAIGCDQNYIAVALLPVVASAIGNTRRVRIRKGWTEPAVLWAAIVGNSGSMKSPALTLALQTVHQRQGRLKAIHETAIATYAAQVREWKKTPPSERGDEPVKPAPMQHAYTSDVTIEALADRLSVSPRGMLVAADELAAWFASFNQYKSGGGADASKWLEMFGARVLKVDRKTGERPTIWVPHAAVALVGGIQPKVLRRALKPEFHDSGLAARLLLTMPPARPKRWTDAEVSDATDSALSAMFEALYQFEGETTPEGGRRPTMLSLDDEARAVFIDYVNDHAREQAELENESLSAVWSKLEGGAARLALLFHCVRQAADEPVNPWAIDEYSVTNGIAVARWFGHEARRVYADLAATDEDRERSALVAWIRGRGSVITVRDLQRGPAKYHGPGAAERALAALVSEGAGEWFAPHHTADGGRPSLRFRLFIGPAVGGDSDESGENPDDDGGSVTVTDGGRRNP